jgi:isochorismate synthase
VALPQGLEGSLHTKIFDELEVAGAAPASVGPLAFVTVPFERTGVITLWVPEHQVTVTPDGTTWLTSIDPDAALGVLSSEPIDALGVAYPITTTTYAPTADSYARAVAHAVESLRRGEIQKVVLARRVEGEVDAVIDPAAVASRLHEREPACTLYAFPAPDGQRFIGASPELLVASIDGSVSAHPLAGTVALDQESDGPEYAQWLLGSTKNLFEHRVVVDDIVERLSSRCGDVRADAKPSIVTLRSVAHLGTWIHGKLDGRSPSSALELLALLHPTAAVGGIPQADALDAIHRLEVEERGLYAGAVGWIDVEGSGEWWLAIRGITLDGSRFHAWAGAGIVADSDPIAEREETRDKLASVLAGLGGSPS